MMVCAGNHVFSLADVARAERSADGAAVTVHFRDYLPTIRVEGDDARAMWDALAAAARRAND